MKPVLVAHRGYSSQYPENTIISMRAALDAGACCIEFDVQLCADAEFAVIHDDSLLRTCSIDRSVFEASVAELGLISAHEADRFGDRYYPENIPSLSQMLEFIAAHPALTAFVEIKEESLQRWGVDTVMRKLIADLEMHQQQCVIISFSEAAIAYASQHSQLRTGWVMYKYDAEHRQLAEKLQPDYLICNQRKIDTQDLWSGKWQWMLYGVESAQLALDWGARGVAYVETDHIAELMQHDALQRGACRHE
jgi:glycerophosphoryl diester phosphodiesterase